jgi:hypothetical protein
LLAAELDSLHVRREGEGCIDLSFHSFTASVPLIIQRLSLLLENQCRKCRGEVNDLNLILHRHLSSVGFSEVRGKFNVALL